MSKSEFVLLRRYRIRQPAVDGLHVAVGRVTGKLRQRTLETVPDTFVQPYRDANHLYIASTTRDIDRARGMLPLGVLAMNEFRIQRRFIVPDRPKYEVSSFALNESGGLAKQIGGLLLGTVLQTYGAVSNHPVSFTHHQSYDYAARDFVSSASGLGLVPYSFPQHDSRRTTEFTVLPPQDITRLLARIERIVPAVRQSAP